MSARERFIKLARELTDPTRHDHDAVASGWFDVLFGLYSEPHRHYHGFHHIANLLERLDTLVPFSGPAMDRLPEAECAIWFHDAVYVIGSKTNEEASALLARGFLFSIGATDNGPGSAGRAGNILDAVNDAIMATKHTGGEVKGNAARVMVDLDLAGFADPWEEFEINNARIRREYAEVPEEDYVWGRTAFLASLLGRRIYSVTTDREAQARANIKRHVKELHAHPTGRGKP